MTDIFKNIVKDGKGQRNNLKKYSDKLLTALIVDKEQGSSTYFSIEKDKSIKEKGPVGKFFSEQSEICK